MPETLRDELMEENANCTIHFIFTVLVFLALGSAAALKLQTEKTDSRLEPGLGRFKKRTVELRKRSQVGAKPLHLLRKGGGDRQDNEAKGMGDMDG